MLNLSQKQSLQQRLSPQQIQYIKLLQLPTLALEQRIKNELEINPVLEEGEDEIEEMDLANRTEEPASNEAETPDAPAEAEVNPENEFDWDDYINSIDDYQGYKVQMVTDDEDRRELPTPYQGTMAEDLMDQVGLLDLDDTEFLLAEQIIGSIDEDGYLRRPIESIMDDMAFNHGKVVSEAAIEEILGRVQRLDPVGVAARDLQECLLVQLDVLPADTPGRETATDMLSKCYKAFTMKHFDQILRRLNVDLEELKVAFELIQHLNPKPGEGTLNATQNYIVPDFTVEHVDGDFIISLNGRNAPQLRISRHYRTMWQDFANEAQAGKSNGEARTFLKSKMEAARWFINSINQRRETMSKVMQAIVGYQQDFFINGEGYLRPMILKDIADTINMDISTVSRVVNGKYVQTEFGVYELKYFFSEGLATDDGEEVSNKEVKALIQSIIDAEDKKRPLSDQRIAQLLEGKGFKIARRTVTKYREQLGIPVARMRKEIVLV